MSINPMESRMKLDEELLAEVQKFSIADIQKSVYERYKKSKICHLTNAQIRDFTEFLQGVGKK